MEQLEQALAKGKRRGYDEFRSIDGTSFLFEYALKKEQGVYSTYFFRIEEQCMDQYEDYAHEEIDTFASLEDALNALEQKGAQRSKLGPIQRVLPF